jgi:ATP-binding cassette subfamily B protein
MDLTEEKDDVNKKFSLKVWGSVLKYTLQKWPLLIVLFITLLITTFYDNSFTPLMNKAAIDTLSGNFLGKDFLDITFGITIFGINFPSVNYIGFAAIIGVGILIRSFAIFFTFFITNLLEMQVLVSLRRDSFNKVQQLSFSYFDKTPSGWLISRMQNDASTISEMLSWGVIRVLWITFDTAFTLVTMFTIDWRLSLLILSLSPVLIVIVTYFNRIILVRHRTARNAYSNYVRWLAECISGIQTIKTLAIEDVVNNEASEVIKDVKDKRYKAILPNAYYSSCFNVLSSITTALIIYVGAYVIGTDPAKEGAISIATLVLFIGFVGSIYNPLAEFSELFAEFVSTQASIEKLMSLINTKPTLVDTPEVIEKYGDVFNNKKENFEVMNGDIYFNHVSFSYIEGTEVLHDLDLHIAKGTSVAIVGETGSGKSTTVSLLCRFYQPSKGEIDIDGINYLSRSVGWLRSNIGLVQQTPFIFSTSIYDNVRYGKLNATNEEIIKACKIVGVHDFIMTLKHGYDTVLEEQGAELSVGQKQLISFARALIRDPKIMILDEATSSIDTETEHQIQTAINKVLAGRTSLIIAHRLSTIVNSDRILVMKDGLVIEDGNHVSLMAKKGYYYELYMNQFKELNIESQIDTYKNQIEDMGIKL